MTRSQDTKERAQELVRGVLRDTFGQEVDEKTVKAVAKKVAKTVELEPIKHREEA
ncbi:MAG: hypothetical protein NW206_05085 [Hyphomonadaceae bacterium]|nr:hypothetical protein [Hyphomonadaceae bacterium]